MHSGCSETYQATYLQQPEPCATCFQVPDRSRHPVVFLTSSRRLDAVARRLSQCRPGPLSDVIQHEPTEYTPTVRNTRISALEVLPPFVHLYLRISLCTVPTFTDDLPRYTRTSASWWISIWMVAYEPLSPCLIHPRCNSTVPRSISFAFPTQQQLFHHRRRRLESSVARHALSNHLLRQSFHHGCHWFQRLPWLASFSSWRLDSTTSDRCPARMPSQVHDQRLGELS
jgi:hypothetical protein